MVETRLLILLAGAVRLKKPAKIVFVGTDNGMKQVFQGWAYPNELLPHLVQAHPKYMLSLQTATAAARQWELVEPVKQARPGHYSCKATQAHLDAGGVGYTTLIDGL